MGNNDIRIKELIGKVDEKRASLGQKERRYPKTNSIFELADGSYLNLNVVSDFDQIVNALAFLIAKKRDVEEACDLLEVDKVKLNWKGYTFEEWRDDFKARVSSIKWDNEKKKLDKMEKELKNLVSEEARTGMTLDSISKLLD